MISVLIVDDNPDFIRDTAGYLSSGNTITVRSAGTAEEAVSVVKQRTTDILVGNYEVPEIDWIALLDRIKGEELGIPVVLYTRRAREQNTIKAMKAGAEFVLPLSGDLKTQFLELRTLIEEIVRRKQVETMQKRAAEDIRAIVTKNADAMVVLDQSGIIQFINPAAESLFNLAEKDMIGKTFGFPILLTEPVEVYILREFRKFVAAEMRVVEVQWKGQPSFLVSIRDVTWHFQYEEELSTAKERLEAEAKNRSKDLLKAYESLRAEVSERKKAEYALRESERKYRQIVELAQEGIWTVNKTGVIKFVNPRCAEMLGYTPEEMLGRLMYDFVESDYIPVQRTMMERRKQGIKESYDCALLKKDGTRLLAIANAAPILDEDGNYAGSISMYTDITARKKSEEELKDAKAQVELYLDLLGHDIRNLMQIGIGYLELATDSDDLGEAKELMAKSLESMRDTSQIIDNVRQLQNTEKITETRQIDLCEILTRLKLTYSVADGRDVTVNLQTIPSCMVKANDLVTDVFSNLLNNSLKHSDPKKPLVINIRVARTREKAMTYIRCEVEDNGPGISNWMKDKIYMRFQRGDTKAHGKGLGLHIARTLVEEYGGKMWVEDRVPGDYRQGARFVIVLPAAS
ncbi:PAS domain S-box protein [Methanocella sp. MCL-LM]|uniref:PAS domain-containing protein n=1 Tax=Methanocella sp. MCL-LM TaxID=3412035 RepID=UPI003C72273E